MDLSFSGAGFMGCYYFGVVDCWNKYIPRERVNRVAGSSAGSLIAAYYLMDLSLSECVRKIIELTEDIRGRSLGVFDRSNQIVDILPRVLDELFAEDAHKQVSGRLFVCMTRAKDMKKIIVSDFETRKDLIDALNCSCFIPLWSGNHCSTYKGEKFIDGGFSDNLPIFDENTIRICCFAGATDISPYDKAKMDMLSGTILNMPFYFSLGNFKRMRRALFPPPASFIVDLLERGFHDTKDFILSNDLIQCESCYKKCNTLHVRQLEAKITPLLTPSVSPMAKRRATSTCADAPPVASAGQQQQHPLAGAESQFRLNLDAKLKEFQEDMVDANNNNNASSGSTLSEALGAPMILISSPEASANDELDSAIDASSSARSRSATSETSSSSTSDSSIKQQADKPKQAGLRRASQAAASSTSRPASPPTCGQSAARMQLRRNTVQASQGSSLLALEDKFTLAPNPLPSCPPSPNLNRHCSECIKLRQEARLDRLEDEIRRQADEVRLNEPSKPAKKGAIKLHLGSPIKWLRQLGVRRSYKLEPAAIGDQQQAAGPSGLLEVS